MPRMLRCRHFGSGKKLMQLLERKFLQHLRQIHGIG
jgi:hypothetical protein